MMNRLLAAIVATLPIACDRPTADLRPLSSWHVEERVRIGVEAGAPPLEFGRIANTVKLADGRIVVADGGNMEVRVFSPDGAHEFPFGRRGSGPGEFTSLTRLALTGDTLVAGGNMRLARYASDGRYLSEARLDMTGFSRPPYFVEYTWPTAAGTFVLTLLRTSAGQPAEMPLHRSMKMYLVTTADAVVDSLGIFPALEQLSYQDGNETRSVIPLFPSDTRAFLGRGHLLIGDMAADSVLLYQLSTRTRTWVTLPLDRIPIDPSALEHAQATACDWTSSQADRTRCESGLLRLPKQEAYPAFRDLAVDSLSAIWLASYSSEANTNVTTWHVFDTNGRGLGTAILPATFRPTQLGADYVLGITRDSVGVERVHEFRLTRS